MWPFSKKSEPMIGGLPVERVGQIPSQLALQVAVYASALQLDYSRVLHSKAVCGHFIGFFGWLEEVNEKHALIMRASTFKLIFGDEEGPKLFHNIMAHLTLFDVQSRRGWGAGVPDGERHFTALQSRQDLPESMESLEFLLKSKLFDIDEQTI